MRTSWRWRSSASGAAFDQHARAQLLDHATRLAGERDKLALILSPLEETAAFASALAVARAIGELSAEVRPTDEARAAGRSGAGRTRPRRRRRSSLPRTSRRRGASGARAPAPRSATSGSSRCAARVALDTGGYRVGVVNGALRVQRRRRRVRPADARSRPSSRSGGRGSSTSSARRSSAGSIHTKGVAILRGYLGRMFGQERPLSLRAQIAFEQSYGEIDGDSASSSELFAVLSALADVGIDQGARGHRQRQPARRDPGHRRPLREDRGLLRSLPGARAHRWPGGPHPAGEPAAPRAAGGRRARGGGGQFHLYAVSSVAQGIEVLTGIPSGDRDEAGRFPASSVFGRVERRIIEIAERLREAEAHGHYDAHEGGDDSSGADLTDGADFGMR